MIKILSDQGLKYSNFFIKLKEKHKKITKRFWVVERTENKELAKQAGIQKHVTIHVLRHRHASQIIMGGVDSRTVQVFLSHSNINTTMQYHHLLLDHLKEVAAKLSLF